MDAYNKYSQGFFQWLIIEFGLSCSLLLLTLAILLAEIYYKIYNILPIIFFTLLIIWILLGLLQRSIDEVTRSYWSIWLCRDGVYGRKFFQITKPKLLVVWEEIEKLVLKKYPLSLNYSKAGLGFVEIHRKDGKKFIISYHGFMPMNKSQFNVEKVEAGVSDYGIVTELFGTIAWKVGLEKFEGFFEEEAKSFSGARKSGLTIDGFKRVMNVIKSGEIPW